MTAKTKLSTKMISAILCFAMILTCLPLSVLTANADTTVDVTGDKVTDTPTVNGWMDLFTDASTRTAGAVWTDKSVFKTAADYFAATAEDEGYTLDLTDENNFLIALSAIASTKEITGYSTTPTDTVFVLDMSSSMEGSNYNSIEPLAKATNNAIKDLLALNKNNRVAVVLYSGEGDTIRLMELDRYEATDADGDFIDFVWINNEEGIAIADGVRDSNGSRYTGQSRWQSGTYTQHGIHTATEILLASDKVITEAGNVQYGQERMPIMVLMTDGEPSVFAQNYATVDDAYNDGGIITGNAVDFMVQLTAAYSKYRIEQAYEEHDLLFYSLGLTGNGNFDTIVMNPEAHTATDSYWNSYLNDDTYTNLQLSAGNRTFSVTTAAATRAPFVAAVKSTAEEDLRPNGLNKYRYYIDEYFQADGDDNLVGVFDSIVDEIILQSMYHPTLVSEGTSVNYGGYLAMVDTLGKYMEVKDMKNIQIGANAFVGRNAARELSALTLQTTTAEMTEIQRNLLEAAALRLGVSEAEALKVIVASRTAGILSYTNETTFDNAIAWYGKYENAKEGATYLADASVATAPADANVYIKSYYFYGASADPTGMNRALDARFIEVDEVTFLDSGETKVRIRIPASLIPLIVYNVTLADEDLNSAVSAFNMTGADAPLRLIYEVGLKDDINALNVSEKAADAYNSETGKYEFYTNKWKYDGNLIIGVTPPSSVAHSYAYFEPSAENEYMNFQYDEELYTFDGTDYVLYTGDKPAAGDGKTYYAERHIYSSTVGSTPTRVYYEIDSSDLETVKAGTGNTWYIPKGTPTLLNAARQINYKDGDTAQNADGGPTGTYKTSSTYWVRNEGIGDEFVYYMETALGNNGKFSMTAEQGIRLQKLIPAGSALDPNADYTFIIKPVSGTLSGSYTTYLFNAIDNDATTGTATESTVTAAADGSLTVTIKANQTLYIADLPAGQYTVTEQAGEEYIVSAIGSTATNSNSTTVTVADNSFTTAAFTNVERGTGNFTVTKEVIHPFGTNYTVPADKTFTVDVTLTLNGEPLANREYQARQSLVTAVTSITTDANGKFTVTLTNTDNLTVYGLPEGTVVTVVEPNPGAGFIEPEYWDNGVRDNGVVTVVANGTVSVLVINEYVPNEVTNNIITLTANKTFTGREWNADDSFEFRLQEWDGTSWVTLATKTITGTQTDKTVDFTQEIKAETYSAIGLYYYRIVEIEPETNPILGVSYDKALHGFVVEIADDDMDGTLEVKTVRKADSSRVEDVTVSGSSAAGYNVATAFENVYDVTATDAAIEIQKHVINASGSPLATPYGFTFEIYESNAEGVIGDKLTTQPPTTTTSGTTRATIHYTAAGVYYYAVKEVAGNAAGWTYSTETKYVTVEVKEAGSGTEAYLVANVYAGLGVPAEAAYATSVVLEFTNTYDPADAALTLDVNKTLTGRDLAAGEFTFVITPYEGTEMIDANGNPITQITGTNGANGKVTFSQPLYFNKVGTYFYNVTEVKGTAKGVTYDETTYRVNVTVQDVNGVLVATYEILNIAGQQIVFANTYTPDPITHTIDGTKALTGRALNAGEFSFVLKDANGTTIETVTNGADGKFAFTAIEYNAAGTYVYTVEEVVGTLGGITYSTEKYTVTVTVTYNSATGTFSASEAIVKTSAQGEPAVDAVSFTNTYDAADVQVGIVGTKVLTGNRALMAGEFSFVLKDANGEVIRTAVNALDGSFFFENLTFTNAGTYTYTVAEVKGDKGGVTYDETVYKVTVVVTDDLEGKLHATVSYVRDNLDATAIVFYNRYDSANTIVQFNGTKTLEGRDLAAGEFEFVLYASDANWATGAVLDTVKNAANGSFSFKEIEYTAEGTHYYLIKEVKGTANGVDYDAAVYKIVVVVEDDDEGSLVAHTTIQKGDATVTAIAFENNYTPDPITHIIDGTKTLTGRDVKPLAAGEFTFVLQESDKDGNVAAGAKSWNAVNNADGSFAFPAIEYSAVGTYHYLVTEKSGTLGGVTYSAEKYVVTVTVTYSEATGEFSAAESIVKIGAQGASAVAAVSFTNEYNAAPTNVTLGGEKELTGRPIASGEFTFELYETGADFKIAAGAEPIRTATNNQDDGRTFKFTAIEYTEVGTYYYVVTERNTGKGGVTYDTAIYNVTVVVTDDGEGQLKAVATVAEGKAIIFNNKYTTESVNVTLEGEKTLTGRDLVEGEFIFVLKDSEDKVVDEVGNDDAGKFTFAALTFTEVGTYVYTVSEVKGNKGGVTYDETVYTVTVVVTDDLNGKLVAAVTIEDADAIVFENGYTAAPTEVELEGSKELTGRDIIDGEFSFILKDENGEEIETVKNVGGSFTFTAIEYTEVGTYVYTVSEVKGNKGGVEYDATVYTVTVVVTDNGLGQLVAEVTINNGGEIAFENTYTVSGEANVTLEGTKTLSGRDLNDGEFTFELYSANSNFETSGEPIKLVKNANGKFVFELKYRPENVGNTYYYVIREQNAGEKINGVYFSTLEYRVTVVVGDDGEGKITTAVTTSADAITFENSYTAEPTEVTLEGEKTLEGRDLVEGEFKFLLYTVDSSFNIPEGAIPEAVVNAADGKFTFDAIEYDSVGTYYYVIAEDTSVEAERMTFDETKFFVTVNVTDDLHGKLVAEYTVKTAVDATEAVEEITFTNVYTPKPTDITVDVNVDKKVESTSEATISPEGFEFMLEKLGTDEKLYVTSDANGDAKFVLTFTEDDIGNTYTYKLTEVAGDVYNVIYSEAVYTITVAITLGEDNNLVATLTMNELAAETLTAEFVNIYNDIPKTGDDTDLRLWTLVLIISGAGLIGTSVFGRKKKENENA